MVGRAPAGVIVPNRRAVASGGVWNRELRPTRAGRTLRFMAERLIERAEVVALLFNVSDIAVTLASSERLLGEHENDGEEEADEG